MTTKGKRAGGAPHHGKKGRLRGNLNQEAKSVRPLLRAKKTRKTTGAEDENEAGSASTRLLIPAPTSRKAAVHRAARTPSNIWATGGRRGGTNAK